MPTQVSAIPIKLIQPHPRLSFRFRYDVDSLAESMKSVADENTPNGQLNPGRLVLRGDAEGYYVYVGVRRYLALKSLYESTRDERFATYSAYIDTNISELQMFIKAKKENDEERGERQGLSVLEEVLGIGRIKDSIASQDLDEGLKRLLAVAQKLGEDKLRKLHEIEGATRFHYRLAHLERLCKIDDEREFYYTASFTAGSQVRGDSIEAAVEDQKKADVFEWFPKLFPDYKQEAKNALAGQGPRSGGSKGESSKRREKRDAVEKTLEVHEKGIIMVKCPQCDSENMIRMEGDVSVTVISPDPNGERSTAVPDTVSRVTLGCFRCSKQFYAFVKHTGGETYAVEQSLSGKFREPMETIGAIELRFDFKEGVWEKISGGKVVGTVYPVIPKKEG